MADEIVIKGAKVHNLKNLSITIPRDKLIVITGLSGSGKSSLAFDTIYAEGQRRYVESLSAYARQFLGLMDKPDVDSIEGLSPAISIDQKSTSHNPRSTVGTVTEIYDYLRLLFSRIGQPHCPDCGSPVVQQTMDHSIKQIISWKAGEEFWLIAPIIRDQKGEHRKVFEELMKTGFTRVRLNGTLLDIQEAMKIRLDKNKRHTLDVVVDRLMVDSKERTRIADSLEQAFDLGNGHVNAYFPNRKENNEILFSQHLTCPHCGISIDELEPRNFSFNSPHGACDVCSGLGTKLEVDPILVMPNPRLSIAEGAIRPWSKTVSNQNWQGRILEEVAKANKFSTTTPVGKLTKKQIDVILHGTKEKEYQMSLAGGKFAGDYTTKYEGVVNNLMRRYRETDSDYIRKEIERYMRISVCPDCHGKRLKALALGVTIGGEGIDKVVNMTIDDGKLFFEKLLLGKGAIKLNVREQKIAKQILREIISRLKFLNDVGLNYLTLDRPANTLSGGEAQRIGSSLVGVVYILDEPSIGLHQRDNAKLIATLESLRDIGNTVIVVEHDEGMILSADQVIDIGPGAGEKGGRLVAQGTPKEIIKNTKSLTGRYLSGKAAITEPKKYRKGNGKKITIEGAEEFNLKNITVDFPLGKLISITGVSGSGKSTLITEILAKSLTKHFYQSKANPGKHKAISGVEHIDKIIDIDQSPIGRTPRSNPATYTGLFTPIRDMFAGLPEARIRGYKAGRFSFNVTGGRCEACSGDGLVKIEMQFLPDVYVECEVCHGKRYNQEALEIHFKGKNISDVLDMTVEEASPFFENLPQVADKLKILNEVGLGYIRLGQPATTLSGGEAQRIKLSTELSRRATGRTLYILDEPTTGLHFDDVKRLLVVLHRLVDKGNTVLVIEHNLDIIKSSDHLVDLGPEGGDRGGLIVGTGSPRELAKIKGSYTGQFLKAEFGKKK
jgi:excinuclease ABC subunit A